MGSTSPRNVLDCIWRFNCDNDWYVQNNLTLINFILFNFIKTFLLAMACCESVRRTFPINFIFLAIFTLAQSFLLGVMSAAYARDEIFLAVGITAAVCLGLTIFAFQTKWYDSMK